MFSRASTSITGGCGGSSRWSSCCSRCPSGVGSCGVANAMSAGPGGRRAVSRYRHALVVGKFAPLHVGHQQLLDHAHGLADEVTVVVWSNPDFEDMPNEVRAD